MAVMTTTKSRSYIGARTRSAIWVANELIRVLFDTVNARGLPLDYLQRKQADLTSDFRTWVAGRWLRELILEVYDPATDTLVEKYVLDLSYDPAAEGEEVFTTRIEKLHEKLQKLGTLRPGLTYKVFVDTAEDAPALGWILTKMHDDRHLNKHDVGNMIDTLNCKVQMALWTEGAQHECK
jgi:hypothetical protein